jgi:ABC-type dipeptide/oligopeptide/nickel transport system ATPase subunit
MAKYGSLPTRGDIADQVLEGLDPRFKVGIEAIAVAKTPYTLRFNDLINSSNRPWATNPRAKCSRSSMPRSKRLRAGRVTLPASKAFNSQIGPMTTSGIQTTMSRRRPRWNPARAPLHRACHGPGHALLRAQDGTHRSFRNRRAGLLLPQRSSRSTICWIGGGQRQRVAIGRAIVRKPDVFLFGVHVMDRICEQARRSARRRDTLVHAMAVGASLTQRLGPSVAIGAHATIFVLRRRLSVAVKSAREQVYVPEY